MRILFIYADSSTEWNCSEWRSLSPADVINRHGKHQAKLLYIQSFVDFNNLAVQDIIGSADIIIVQRNLTHKSVWDAIDYWKGLDRTVVADLDDDYPNLPWSNPAHEYWLENKSKMGKPPVELLTEGLRHCDALLSPSKVILKDWESVVPGVWMPNYARGDWWLNVRERKPSLNKIIIGWGGSVSHYDSWLFSGIIPALEDICREHPNVALKICGNDSRLPSTFNIPKDQLIIQEGVSAKDWCKMVGTFDIGLAPLDMRDGARSYDNHRSWIKALEFMLACVPWVGSKSDVYADLAEHGVVVENTKEQWKTAIEDILRNIEQAKRFARRKRRIAWSLTLENNIENMVQTYERIKQRTLRDKAEIWWINRRVGDAQLQERRKAIKESPAEEPVESTPALKLCQTDAYELVKQWGQRITFGGRNFGRSMEYDLLSRVNR